MPGLIQKLPPGISSRNKCTLSFLSAVWMSLLTHSSGWTMSTGWTLIGGINFCHLLSSWEISVHGFSLTVDTLVGFDNKGCDKTAFLAPRLLPPVNHLVLPLQLKLLLCCAFNVFGRRFKRWRVRSSQSVRYLTSGCFVISQRVGDFYLFLEVQWHGWHIYWKRW